MNNLQKIDFATGTDSGYSKKSNDSKVHNLFLHTDGTGSKSKTILMNTEGTKALFDLEYKIYGIYEFLGKIYIATDSALYVYNGDTRVFNEPIRYSFDLIGYLSFSDEVVFADNGIDLIMVGGNGYAYSPDSGEIKDMREEEGWYPASTVAYMDGYFIFNRKGTGQFFISKLYSTELDAIDWATGESAPDDTVAVAVSNRQLWIIGEKTSEVWYDSGDPDFPFTRVSGAVNDIGMTNSNTLAKIRDSLLFVGNDFKVYATSGYKLEAISTPAIERLLLDCNIRLLNGFSYSGMGHWFYVLHIDNKISYVYDVNTGLWHTRGTQDKSWFVNGAINLNQNNTVIGYSNSNIYEINIDFLTDDDNLIKREVVSLPINKGVNRFKLAEVQLDMEVSQEVQSEVALYVSSDGGRKWSNKNLAYVGEIGQSRQRVRWLRLGQHRDCILKIVIFEPITIRLLGLYARTS